MKKPMDSRIILNGIRKMSPGRAFTWRDLLAPELGEARIQAELARLARRGSIRRKTAGIYYIAAKGWLGEAPLTEEKVLAEKLKVRRLKDKEIFGDRRETVNRLIAVGPTLFYNLGLTTQLPRQKEYVSTIAFQGISIRVKRAHMEQFKNFTDEQVAAFFGLADLKKVRHESFDVVVGRFKYFLGRSGITRGILREIAVACGGIQGRHALENLELMGQPPTDGE